VTSESTPPLAGLRAILPLPAVSTTRRCLICGRRRTPGFRSARIFPPRTGSCWLVLQDRRVAWRLWPREHESRIVCSPFEPPSTRRSSRSCPQIGAACCRGRKNAGNHACISSRGRGADGPGLRCEGCSGGATHHREPSCSRSATSGVRVFPLPRLVSVRQPRSISSPACASSRSASPSGTAAAIAEIEISAITHAARTTTRHSQGSTGARHEQCLKRSLQRTRQPASFSCPALDDDRTGAP